ncbi:lysophospholipid acyltransferase family protein [Opacimonas viscosa]|uniref:L-ornithine N(alpha)-acyltransferase n=1 Tax=Opacimonas viscosa TaxID=2961944 RepID=A0AA41WXZ7_9ALTE|nr:lysophospholipid acyltransferase family protein [Opacimonas viscosa]MCP3428145.1 lysophospholipid acyltransferase family protein [Opacimonas viscosa]
MTSSITPRIAAVNLVSNPTISKRLMCALLDHLMGVKQMDKLYQTHQLAGLNKADFAKALLDIQKITAVKHEALLAKIPATGPVIIASNHPFGGIEGVLLAKLISAKRPDLKVFVNKALAIFPELQDYFIFTNPLSPNDPKNAPSLRQAMRHLAQHKALLIFPAGRVSYYQAEFADILDHDWNKMVYTLSQKYSAPILPVFVQGFNRPYFYTLGRIYFRLRMLLLGRELLAKRNTSITLDSGNPVTLPPNLAPEQGAALARALAYAVDSRWHYHWPEDTHSTNKPLANPQIPADLWQELAALPKEQCLIEQADFVVYWSMQAQTPKVVNEIAMLREKVFRMHNEGSGEPLDTDHFDASYTHLFIWHKPTQQIIGAYRMGRTDILQKDLGLDGLYLNKMFKFGSGFINQQEPCLEMGRSFLIPEFQRSPQGLFMLWRGIGEFIMRFPQYRVLYGTVSISKLYRPQSVSIIEHGLINAPENVVPHHAFDLSLPSQIQAYHAKYGLADVVTTFLQALEDDGKDIPVLAKQYQKLGADFHALGIDHSFNHTPGLLLSVDLRKTSPRQQKRFLGQTL